MPCSTPFIALFMKLKFASLVAVGILAGCASPTVAPPAARPAKAEVWGEPGSNASTVNAYKRELAQRISQMNASKVYSGQPQALLRSVVVLRYSVDARGNLVHSEIQRSNRDPETEATALASLRNSAPFPKPAANLLRRGQLEMSETWLFNNDGRFQLRTIAQPQINH
jgi:protein TonB